MQTKLVFPAPDPSYSTTTSLNQVIYFPRDLMKRTAHMKPHPLQTVPPKKKPEPVQVP